MVGPYFDKWLEAMKSEIGFIYQNKVWTLVDLPDDRQAIEINGSLRRRRTWTVMLPSMKLDLWQRVFSQVQGVDYDEIFSSVAMLKSVGIMLALAAFMKSGRWMSKQVSLPVFVRKGCMWYNQKGFVLRMLKGMLAPAILPWIRASISESEYTLWWSDQSFWVYTKFVRILYLQ